MPQDTQETVGEGAESGKLNSRQIAFLRDFRRHGLMAFFDSPFRLDAPGLRDLGIIGGIGDSTHITEAGMVELRHADATLRKAIATRAASL